MVEIETEEQNDALHDEAVKQKFPSAWIGLSDTAKEGEWVWNSDPTDEATFTSWNSVSPSNSKHKNKDGENCAILVTPLATKSGKPQPWAIPKQWNDGNCLSKNGVICQEKARVKFTKPVKCEEK